jgi:hypothetical protein
VVGALTVPDIPMPSSHRVGDRYAGRRYPFIPVVLMPWTR